MSHYVCYVIFFNNLLNIHSVLLRTSYCVTLSFLLSTELFKQFARIPLTTTESELLDYLVKRPDIVISKSELQKEVLKKDLCPFDRNLDMHISNIRRKMVKLGLSKQHIKTVRGKGYSFIERV